MNEARPYASLSSGLLARKGSAKPAMRPQGYGQGYGNLEDLGWNDMGQPPAEPGQPAAPAEHVPSSIAALTPAPKIQRTNPTDAHLPPDVELDLYGEDEALEDEAAEGLAETAHEPLSQTEDEPVAGPEVQPFAELEAEPFAEPEAEPFAEPEAETFAEPEIDSFAETEPEPSVAEAQAEEETPHVVAQQRAILERFDAGEELDAPDAPLDARAEIVPLPQRAAKGDRRKAAFTLRLDAERHLRLRLACAVTRHSAQQIVARALDEALASIPEIEALASQVPAKPGRAGKR